MAEPRVPGGDGDGLTLPCGEQIAPRELDMGLREIACDCGESHAVVMDVHPPSRFVPEQLVGVLQETVEPADEFEEFNTAHLLGMAMEEFPEQVVSEDFADDGTVGWSLLWITAFDARRLHEVVVELVVELMDHAVSHSDDSDAGEEFEAMMREFDVEEFVERYRRQREFDDEHDTAA
mgnify:CR=1 FL=1